MQLATGHDPGLNDASTTVATQSVGSDDGSDAGDRRRLLAGLLDVDGRVGVDAAG